MSERFMEDLEDSGVEVRRGIDARRSAAIHTRLPA